MFFFFTRMLEKKKKDDASFPLQVQSGHVVSCFCLSSRLSVISFSLFFASRFFFSFYLIRTTTAKGHFCFFISCSRHFLGLLFVKLITRISAQEKRREETTLRWLQIGLSCPVKCFVLMKSTYVKQLD